MGRNGKKADRTMSLYILLSLIKLAVFGGGNNGGRVLNLEVLKGIKSPMEEGLVKALKLLCVQLDHPWKKL